MLIYNFNNSIIIIYFCNTLKITLTSGHNKMSYISQIFKVQIYSCPNKYKMLTVTHKKKDKTFILIFYLNLK